MEIIDRAAWPREGHYRFFEPMSNPIFALTFPVDVTNLRAYVKERGLSFYTALVFLVTKSLEDLEDFCRRAKEKSAAQAFFLDDASWGDELVYFTCLPWFPITGALNERNNDPSDAIPRIAWGKWEEKDGRTILSVSLEANHRLIDGVHVGQFYQALERRLAAL